MVSALKLKCAHVLWLHHGTVTRQLKHVITYLSKNKKATKGTFLPKHYTIFNAWKWTTIFLDCSLHFPWSLRSQVTIQTWSYNN